MSDSRKLSFFTTIIIAILTAIAIPNPAYSADRIVARFPPFKDFKISTAELKTFAKTGELPTQFAEFTKSNSPAQLPEFRQLLQQRFKISPLYVSQFTHAPLVEKLLERIGDAIKPSPKQNGMRAIRTALIRAAEDKQGLSVINAIEQFPSRTVNLELSEIFTLYDNLTELLKRRGNLVAMIDRLTDTAATSSPTNFSQQPDLRQAGRLRWQKQSFAWKDRSRSVSSGESRNRLVPGDLYLPQTTSTVPIIVISHGAAEDRTAYAYLAAHLASHGFAVVALEHVGGDANRFRNYFSGLAPAPKATELLERPRDVSFALDELQRRSVKERNLQQLNFQQVGLIGHSLGGYTVLALAGAEIDFALVKRNCNPNRSLNISVLLQCRANELTAQPDRLQDPRIRAIFAINPLGSAMFGKQGLSQIRIPTFLLGGSDDIITPAVPEQIYPFTWLQTSAKYLAILNGGTHFSTPAVSQSDGIFPISEGLIGANPLQAQTYTKALSLAFFQTHLANRAEFGQYLHPAYGRAIDSASLRLNLLPSSAAASISQALERDPSRAPKLVGGASPLENR
jgi:predicted dienelactone hydrolase